MTHTVRDWMSSPVVVIPAEMPVNLALTLMRRRGIRSLVVDLAGGDKPQYGILTTTDIRDKIV
ncbi:MAG: CBS domain-containing protein, partial [Anaerolineales bacterium]